MAFKSMQSIVGLRHKRIQSQATVEPDSILYQIQMRAYQSTRQNTSLGENTVVLFTVQALKHLLNGFVLNDHI